jgi:hypothetical protein
MITNQIRLLKLLAGLFVGLLFGSLAIASTSHLVEQIKFDDAALKAAEQDYRVQRELNSMSEQEAADYASYVAGLQRRVFEDCAALIRSGSEFPADLPCPVIVPPVTQSADIAIQKEQTPEEQIAAMDAMLNAGLGAYDERLLREQERIKAATPNNNAGGDGGYAGGGAGDASNGSDGSSDGDAGNTDQQADSTGEAGRQTEDGNAQQRRGPVDNSEGAGAAGQDKDVPADIPDGSDDDIVARQLREAAERETDPELKAKLWDEYRRYKQGTN